MPATFVVWHFHSQTYADAGSSAFGLRLAAVTIGLGLAFVLDDPTEESLGYTPISVLTRRLVRIVLTLPPTILFWLLLRGYASGGLIEEQTLPAWPFLLEALALGGVAFAGAGMAARLVSDRLGGLGGAGAVIIVAFAVALLPWANGLWTRTPGTKPSDASVMWWWAILGAAVLTFWRSSVVTGIFRLRR
ncbi:MAG: hypothetical protein GEU71_00955 [Actinobacteria bacterium]|nr:hypothetical protein [Actinomycetota bacterium]